eukprot:647334-Rhodomonas_salina.1
MFLCRSILPSQFVLLKPSEPSRDDSEHRVDCVVEQEVEVHVLIAGRGCLLPLLIVRSRPELGV